MIIDVLVLITVFISMGVAFFRGFIREVLTIAGVSGGLAAAYWGGPKLNVPMRGWLGVDDDPENVQKLFDLIPYSMVSTALSYGLIFIVVVITLSIISHFLAEFAQNMGLGAVDRTFGVIFGGVRAMLLLGLLYLPLYALVERETREEWFAGSRTHTYVQGTAHWLSGFIPAEGLKIKKEDLEADVKERVQERVKAKAIEAVMGDSDGATAAPTQDNTAAPIPPQTNTVERGYSDDVRQELDQLIEETTTNNNDSAAQKAPTRERVRIPVYNQ